MGQREVPGGRWHIRRESKREGSIQQEELEWDQPCGDASANKKELRHFLIYFDVWPLGVFAFCLLPIPIFPFLNCRISVTISSFVPRLRSTIFSAASQCVSPISFLAVVAILSQQMVRGRQVPLSLPLSLTPRPFLSILLKAPGGNLSKGRRMRGMRHTKCSEEGRSKHSHLVPFSLHDRIHRHWDAH